jgi:hypothetical protein
MAQKEKHNVKKEKLFLEKTGPRQPVPFMVSNISTYFLIDK